MSSPSYYVLVFLIFVLLPTPALSGNCSRKFKKHWSSVSKQIRITAKMLMDETLYRHSQITVKHFSGTNNNSFTRGSMYELQRVSDLLSLLQYILQKEHTHYTHSRTHRVHFTKHIKNLRDSMTNLIPRDCVMIRRFETHGSFKPSCLVNVAKTSYYLSFHIRRPGKKRYNLPSVEHLCKHILSSCHCSLSHSRKN